MRLNNEKYSIGINVVLLYLNYLKIYLNNFVNENILVKNNCFNFKNILAIMFLSIIIYHDLNKPTNK